MGEKRATCWLSLSVKYDAYPLPEDNVYMLTTWDQYFEVSLLAWSVKMGPKVNKLISAYAIW